LIAGTHPSQKKRRMGPRKFIGCVACERKPQERPPRKAVATQANRGGNWGSRFLASLGMTTSLGMDESGKFGRGLIWNGDRTMAKNKVVQVGKPGGEFELVERRSRRRGRER
jgi:hypothetical protein